MQRPPLKIFFPLVRREIPFRANWSYLVEVGNGIASASAFPSTTWERGLKKVRHATAFWLG
jgi:hypothetical protein